MEYVIYTFGNGEILKGLFDAIAMLVNSSTGTLYHALIRISLIIGAFWAAVYAIYGDQVKLFTNWILPSVAIMNLLFAPQATVWINDPVTRYHEKVDHVPYGLAAFAGTISKFGRLMTEQVETIFHLPDDIRYNQAGCLFASNMVQQAKTFRITNEDLAENMRSFVGQCVVYDALLGSKYTIDELRNSDDIWELVSTNASPVRSFPWREVRGEEMKDADKRPTIITCREGVNRFSAQWSGLINTTGDLFGRKIFGNTGLVNARAELFKHLDFSYEFLTRSARKAQDIIKQNIMIHAVVDGIEQKSVALGNAPNFATRRAYLQQRSTYETLGAMAADTLPAMKAVLEGLAYASFLFIIPLALLPFGYKFLLSWAQIILWLQLWAPLYAVLNYMVSMAAQSKSVAALSLSNSNGVTIASSVGLANVNADIAAMAGYLAMSIPFICIALVKGVGSFVHLASHLGNISQGAAQTAAGEATTGNYSFGNVTAGTSQIANTSMLNHSMAASYRSGSFQQSDGRSDLITASDGTQIANIATSSIPMSLGVAESTTSQRSQMASQSWQKALNLTESTAEGLNSTYRQFAELSDHLSKGEGLSQGSSIGQSTEDAKAIHGARQKIEQFASDNRLNYEQAAQVLGEAGASIGGGPVSAGIKTSLSGSASDQKAYSAAQTFVSHKDFQETMRAGAQASKNISHSTNDETTKKLSEGVSGSFEASQQNRMEAAKSFREAQEYQSQASATQATASSINANYNQEFVQWMASQRADNTGGTLGTRGAMHVIANEPKQRAQYAQQFMKEKGLYPSPSSVPGGASAQPETSQKAPHGGSRDSASAASSSDLSKTLTTGGSGLRESYEKEKRHGIYQPSDQGIRTVKEEAAKHNLGVDRQTAAQVDQTVAQQEVSVQGKIDTGRVQRSQDRQQLQQKYQDRKDKALLPQAAGAAAQNVAKTGSGVLSHLGEGAKFLGKELAKDGSPYEPTFPNEEKKK